MAGNWWEQDSVVSPTTAAPVPASGVSGYIPGRTKQLTPEQAAAAARDATKFNERNDPRLKAGYRWKDGVVGGTAELIPGTADESAKPSEYQAKSAGFYGRMLRAEEQFNRVPEGSRDPRTWVGQAFHEWAPNLDNNLNTSDRQIADASALDFVRATLRQESGASINADEELKQYRIFFPMPGDTPQTLAAKAAARKQAMEGFRVAAGPLASEIEKTVVPSVAMGGGSVDAGPKGYRFDADAVTALNSYLHSPAATPEGYKSLHDRLAGRAAVVSPEEAARTVAAIKANPNAKFGIDYSKIDAPVEERAKALADKWDSVGPPRSDTGTVLNEGASVGLSGEAAGVGNAISGVLNGDLNLADNYRVGRDAKDLQIAESRKKLGWASTPVEIAGGLVSANPSAIASAVTPALGQTIRAGAKAGTIGGGVAGFGYGKDTEGSLVGAALGAGTGATLGAALPVAGRLISDRVAGARALVGADPALPRRIVARAIENDGNTPGQVGAVLDQAATRGSPLSLADTGENTRALLGSMGRQPGPSRTLTRQSVISRQEGQQERIGAAVVRDLGPTANIRQAEQQLVERAKRNAGPIYDQFEAAPGASSVKLDDLMTRPSFQNGLKRAQRLAQEEGVDPKSLGFDLTDTGEVVLGTTPSFKTLDYVKRGLDDVVEQYRDGTTGRLNLDGEGRAINNTLRSLISRIDGVNPHYAEARAAYAGPVKMAAALKSGNRALNKTADDIDAEFGRLSPSEQETYRLGLRKAITDHLETKGDYADKVNALVGTPKKRAALQRVFGDAQGFDNFIATLGDERAMAETYRSVAGNSMTAERAAQDAATGDSGLLDDATDRALRGMRDGIWPTIIDGFAKLRSAGQFGAGQAGERTRERIAALLTETDPTVLRDIILAARNAQVAQGRAAQRLGRVATVGGSQTGRTVGAALAPKGERK